MADPVRQRVLDAVEAGRLPRGGPSHLAALDMVDEFPEKYWHDWNDACAERIRSRAQHPRCRCGSFAEPEADGRCARCAGFPS
jgi:hypothetical protein